MADDQATSVATAGELDLPRIKPRILRQEVLGALRTAILANTIPAGSRLLEAEVAQRMGVSRAPVREALRHLEQEGLVEFFPHRGAVVVGLPEREIDAIYELRATIESRAMADITGKTTEEQIGELEALIDEMRTILPVRDIEQIAEIDLRFHGLIVEWSGLTLLRHIWSSLDGLVRLRSYQALDRPGKAARYFLTNAAGSHVALIDALRAGDPVAAAKAARDHVIEVPTMLAGLDVKKPRRAGRGGLSVANLRSACAAIDPEPIADLTLELLRIWSPPGDEARMAERLADELSSAGVRVRIDREYPSSPSVIGELGAASGPTIQWHGHMDAIDIEHTPPERVGNLLIGRGSADMKGPDASMVTAARLLAEHGVPGGGRVLITFHGRHETGGNEPLHALIARGIHGDAVLTGELGGGVELPIAGLGLTFWEVTVDRPGMSIHENSITPDTMDPLEVGRILHGELAALRDRLAAIPGEDPKPSLFIGKFVSGDYVNRLPIRAALAGTRRHDTSGDLDAVAAELRDLVDGVGARTGATIHLQATSIAESFEVDPAEPLVGATLDAHRELFGNDLRLTRSRLASNAVHFVREAGIPALGYGPDPATNHSDREVLAVSELARLAGGFALASAYYLERVAR